MLLRKWQGKPLIEQKKKEMLKEIERQKSIFKKISIPYDGVEFTEKGMCVTKLEKQGDAEHKKFLKVEVKYFYDSNGKLDELATEYKPISGNGDLKIPGVNGKIYTILVVFIRNMREGWLLLISMSILSK